MGHEIYMHMQPLFMFALYRSAKIVFKISIYRGTLLNGHTSMADTCDIMANSECPDCISIDFNIPKPPSTADTPLFHIMDTYFGPV